MRALEVVIGTGRNLSDLDIDPDKSPDCDFRGYFLSRPRLDLFHRVGRRCEQMVGNVPQRLLLGWSRIMWSTVGYFFVTTASPQSLSSNDFCSLLKEWFKKLL